MNRYRSIVSATLMVFAAACTEPAPTLAGQWTEILSSSASHTPRRLDLGLSGTFSLATGPTGIGTRIEGTYKVSGTSLAFYSERIVVGGGSNGPYPTGGLFGDATFGFDGDVLVLNYTTYPLDGPVP